MAFFYFPSDYAEEAYSRLSLDLGLERVRSLFQRVMRGRLDGFDVRIVGSRTGVLERVELDGCGQIPRGLYLGSIRGHGVHGAVRTGDEGFDARVLVDGPLPRTLGMLDQLTRRLALFAVDHLGGVVDDGAISLSEQAALRWNGGLPMRGELDGRACATVLRELLQFGQRLCAVALLEPKVLLARNVEQDPRSGVRRCAFAHLVRAYPEGEATARAATAVLRHYDYELRLDAAAYLAGPPRNATEPLEAIYRDAHAPDDLRARAFRRRFVVGVMAGETDLLEEGLLSDAVPLRSTALSICTASARDPGPEIMRSLLEHHDAETVASAAHLTAVLNASRYEPQLIGLLGHPSFQVQWRAAQALGRVGGAGAMEPLRVAAGRFLIDARLRRVLADAMALIRARSAHEPGELSLVQTDVGGSVSLARPEGSLSHPREAKASSQGELRDEPGRTLQDHDDDEG